MQHSQPAAAHTPKRPGKRRLPANEEINAARPAVGDKDVVLELLSEDDRDDAREATQVTQDGRQQYVAVIRDLNSGTSMAALRTTRTCGHR